MSMVKSIVLILSAIALCIVKIPVLFAWAKEEIRDRKERKLQYELDEEKTKDRIEAKHEEIKNKAETEELNKIIEYYLNNY